MARVNITVPDELIARARAEGLNVSQAAAAGIEAQLVHRDKITALHRYLKELDEELGPVTEEEEREAQEWVQRMLDTKPVPRAADRAA